MWAIVDAVVAIVVLSIDGYGMEQKKKKKKNHRCSDLF